MSTRPVTEPGVSIWRTPARVTWSGGETASIIVDAWDHTTPIPIRADALPKDVAVPLRAGESTVLAEVRVNLGATTPEAVIHEVVKFLPPAQWPPA